MLMALNAKHKLGFVDGLILQPPLDDPFVGVWPRCNDIVTSWLLNLVSKEIVVVYFILTVLKPFGQIDTIGFIKATPHIFFRSSNNCMVCFKVPLISILWDKHKNFQPVPICQCGGMKAWMDYQQ